MVRTLKQAKTWIIYGAMVCGGLLGTRGCNDVFNNQTVNKPAYFMKSEATGILGHKEYVEYPDGSKEIKLYPNYFGHRWGSSEFCQDLDGDGTVDRIRINGPEWKMHTLEAVLVREQDYETHKSKFDAADKKLQEMMAKYNK
jgi:hypothetical protein